MGTEELLLKAREIWKEKDFMDLSEIVPAMGKVFGDICELERDDDIMDQYYIDNELKKELGNMIFSSIRWIDDLGYDIDECIEAAIKCQKEYVKKRKEIFIRGVKVKRETKLT